MHTLLKLPVAIALACAALAPAWAAYRMFVVLGMFV